MRIRTSLLLLPLALVWIGCSEDAPFEPEDGGPAVRVTIPIPTANPAHVPSVFTVKWVAENAEAVRWIMLDLEPFDRNVESAVEYLRTNEEAAEWSDWHDYNDPDGSGRSWTSPDTPFGWYIFAVVGKGAEGDVSGLVLGENIVRLQVSDRRTGPLLSLYNRYVGTVITATTETPATIFDVPSGVTMDFTLSAEAEHYGGVVTGYRYGWDISDLEDDSQWEIDFTPFVGEAAEVSPPMALSGTRRLFVEVIDNEMFKSRASVVMNAVLTTMQHPVLLVDDWAEDGEGWEQTAGAVPSDSEHDAFWNGLLSDVAGFEPARDVIELAPGAAPPPLDVLLGYQNILWNSSGAFGMDTPPVLASVIRWIDPRVPISPDVVVPNLIALYMAAGGHVMISGERVISLAVHSLLAGPVPYPIILRYEIGGDEYGHYDDFIPGTDRRIGEDSFAYRTCCLNVLDAISLPPTQRRGPDDPCWVDGTQPFGLEADGIRSCLPIDLSTGPGFPRLELRPEASDPGRSYAARGLNSDIYNPRYFEVMSPCGPITEYGRTCFDPIYGNGCREQTSLLYRGVVAYWTSVFADRTPAVGGVAARSAIWGFHPVYFDPGQVKAALDIVLFNEWKLPRN